MSHVYSKNMHNENLLRSFKDGKLKVQVSNISRLKMSMYEHMCKKKHKRRKVKNSIFYDEDSNLSTNEFHIMKNNMCHIYLLKKPTGINMCYIYLLKKQWE
jgi:hypothetical protein